MEASASLANINLSGETERTLTGSEAYNKEEALLYGSGNQNVDTCLAGVRIQEKINFLLMDSLYKAAVEGNIAKFEEHANILDQILTPKENTILHIHITARPKRAKPNIFEKIGLKKKSEEGIHRNNFVTDILEMCPALLGKANSNGETLLHRAARHGHADIVKVLIAECKKPHQNDLEKGVAVTRQMLGMTNEAKSTALHEAVRYNQVDVVKILTKENPDLSYDANNAGETPLYLAAERGYRDVAKDILFTCKLPADHGPMGRTALHAAVFCNDKEMTKMLLDSKKDLNSKPDQRGWLPLHLAAHFGFYNILKELLNTDKSTAYKADNEGKTALHVAAGLGKVFIMQELIRSCPGCVELVDNNGWNVFHFALDSKNSKAVQLLLNNPSLGNLINEKNNEGNTPLLQLAASGSYMKSFVCHPKVDKLAFNHQNHNAADIILLNILISPKEILFLRCLHRLKGNYGRRQIVRGGGEGKDNEGNIVSNKSDVGKEKKNRDEVLDKYIKEGKDADLVVAALIATVTFTAGITLPGGYINERGPDQGTAVLTRSVAFQAFVIFNTIAMIFSTCAVFIHLFVSMTKDKVKEFVVWNLGLVFIMYAMVAMVLAFLMGTYAVLYRAKELTISVCVIGCLFFVVFAYFEPLELLGRMVRKLVRMIVRKLSSEFGGIRLRR